MRHTSTLALAAFLAIGTAIASGCGSDDDDDDDGSGGSGGSPDNTGSVCKVADDCFPGVDAGSLAGEVECLDRVQGGYCTHQCASDDDCCAVEGECKTSLLQVCSPFESVGYKMCFLSCENADVTDGGAADPEEHCQKNVGPDFICRSSGGGSENRKVCVPGDCDVNEDCTDTVDCAAGLTCVKDFQGGVCTKADCSLNADCPNGSSCVKSGDKNYCMKTCTGDTDCSFCRAYSVRSTCKSDATFAEAGTTGSVCVPPS
jgi:hypothetical protein